MGQYYLLINLDKRQQMSPFAGMGLKPLARPGEIQEFKIPVFFMLA